MKNIGILGATGSIGTQTLDVLRKENENFTLKAISSHSNYKKTIEIIEEFKPEIVAVTEKVNFSKVRDYVLSKKYPIEVVFGMEGLNTVAKWDTIDILVTSIVGMVGLTPTLEAIKAGKDIALANKETLVVGGEIVIGAAKKRNVKILPVDSEHGAIFQCLQGNSYSDINKILLTASGGPFRGKTANELLNVTVDEALCHPKWNMGKKISIDSATMANKGLEVIEAHWLFGVDASNIQVIIHPESIVHSMIEYKDGSIIAQLASTDMRLPIQYALNYPRREKRVVNQLDFYKLKNLSFYEPDMITFRPLKLAYDALNSGKLMPTIFNSANEKAVELFLNKQIKFLQIGEIIEKCMEKFDYSKEVTVENIVTLDKSIKQYIANKFQIGR